MTDEEMAEEYFFDVANKDGFVHNFHDVKQAFLAGRKARPQWHDLWKDKNDLPKENCKVYLYAKDKEYYMGFLENGAWKYEGGFYASNDFVIAWCELPTFNKE